MIDAVPPSPLLIARIPVERGFTPMSMTERAEYVRRKRLDDLSLTTHELHNQFAEEAIQSSLRRLKNSSALSNKIAYKRGEPHEREF
jgi:hypothetical protein